MSESDCRRVQENILRSFCIKILLSVKVPQEEGEIVADFLVSADLQGVSTHGVISLSRYVSLIKSGIAHPSAKIQVVKDSGSTTLWDGCGSLGQVLGIWAMEKCLDKAKTYGIGVIGVKKSNHFGTCAYYAMKALEHDMIGIVLSTASPLMAPWGGCEPLLGNNPFAVAIPCGKELPIVLDIAQSVVSAGKLHLLKKQGKTKIPRGWAMNKEGKTIENLEEALEKLLLVPMGGHKGYGIALVIDVLSGILLGAGYGFSAKDGEEGPGHFFAAIRIDAFRPIEEFKQAMDNRVRELKNSKLAEGADRILMPGEIEFETEIKRRKEGIPIPCVVVDELNQLAESLNLPARL